MDNNPQPNIEPQATPEPFQQPTPIPPTTETQPAAPFEPQKPAKKSKNKLIIFLIIIAMLLIGGGVTAAVLLTPKPVDIKVSNKEDNSEKSSTKTPAASGSTTTESSSALSNDYSGWTEPQQLMSPKMSIRYPSYSFSNEASTTSYRGQNYRILFEVGRPYATEPESVNIDNSKINEYLFNRRGVDADGKSQWLFEGYPINRIDPETSMPKTVNGISALRVIGKAIFDSFNAADVAITIKKYVISYTFTIDGTPCQLLGFAYDRNDFQKDDQTAVDDVTKIVDLMMQTVKISES